MKFLMSIFKNAGFVCLVLGLGGTAGAIEFGTGYLSAGGLLIGGALMLYEDYRLGGIYREKDKDIIDLIAGSADAGRRGKSRKKR